MNGVAVVGGHGKTGRATVTALTGRGERAVPVLRAMFASYDVHGLPAGTLPLRALLGRP